MAQVCSRYAFRRCAARLLTARPSTLASAPRTYSSFAATSQRITPRSVLFNSQRRWATTESEKEGAVPISELQATSPEEVENAIQSEVADEPLSASDTAPAIAESANLTEATEEALPAAETNETLVGSSHQEWNGQSRNSGGEEPQKKQTVYVGNLFFDVTESDLVKEFTRFGTVSRCRMIRDSRGLSKGFVSSTAQNVK